MNKPLTMIIKETKARLTEACNIALQSGMSFAMLDLVMQEIYLEVHSIAEKQALQEELAYMMTIEKDVVENNCQESESVETLVNEGNCYEQE